VKVCKNQYYNQFINKSIYKVLRSWSSHHFGGDWSENLISLRLLSLLAFLSYLLQTSIFLPRRVSIFSFLFHHLKNPFTRSNTPSLGRGGIPRTWKITLYFYCVLDYQQRVDIDSVYDTCNAMDNQRIIFINIMKHECWDYKYKRKSARTNIGRRSGAPHT
jgi:hypothetical protein